MNWLEIYHVMMKELYDISVLFLRCLREIEKWSWILILRKNEEKSVKMAVPKSANIYYYGRLTCRKLTEDAVPKSIDQGQPVRTAQADFGRYFLEKR